MSQKTIFILQHPPTMSEKTVILLQYPPSLNQQKMDILLQPPPIMSQKTDITLQHQPGMSQKIEILSAAALSIRSQKMYPPIMNQKTDIHFIPTNHEPDGRHPSPAFPIRAGIALHCTSVLLYENGICCDWILSIQMARVSTV
jgi:hypothetical protein